MTYSKVAELMIIVIVYFVFKVFSNTLMAVAFTIPFICLRLSTWFSNGKKITYLDYIAILCPSGYFVFVIQIWFACFAEYTVPTNVATCIFILSTIIFCELIVFVVAILFKTHFIVFLSLVPILISLFIGHVQIFLYVFHS